MKSINHLKPSIVFALPPKEGDKPPCLTLLPLPEKKGEELEELVKRGVCNKYGEVSEPFSSVDLQTLDLKEATPIFKEIFQKRESLLNQEHSLVINMGHSLGTLVKWMIIKGYNNFHPCIQGDFVPYLLFHLLPGYAKREFESLGVDHKSNERVILCPKRTLVGIECAIESSLETIMNVALKSIARTIRLCNPSCLEKITKNVVQSQLVEGELFLERTMKFSSKSSLQERDFVHLRLKERPEKVERPMDVCLFNQSRPQTFTANSLYIPLEEVLGLYWTQYSVRDLKFRCKPQSFEGSPLQAFLDCYFGFIRGPGNWFELISLYVRGFTSMERDPFLEQRTFEKYYNNNPEKLAEWILEELDKTYPNDPEFHLFFLLNASISLFENGKEREVEIFLEKTLNKLTLDPNSNPALLLLVNLIKKEKIPFSLLLTFLQVTSFLMLISNQSGGDYGASLKSEERRRDVVLLHIGPHILRMPYKNSQPFYELYGQLVKNPNVENKLLQLFMILRPTDVTILKTEVDRLNIIDLQIDKIAGFFLDSPSYLLNGIGLATKLSLGEELPPPHKIAETLIYLELHYSGVEDPLPLQTFICEIIGSSIGGLSVAPQQNFTIVDNKFKVADVKERTAKEMKRFRGAIDLTSRFILDLKELNPLFWAHLYRAAAEVNMTMDLLLLWEAHVKNYLAASPTEHRLAFNALLFGLKKCASEGNMEASLFICNSFKDYCELEIDNSRLLDLSISDLLIFVTETFLHIQSDRKWIEPLSAMVKLLFTHFDSAQVALSKNKGSALGCNAPTSMYFEYHVTFSIEYFDILFAHANLEKIRKMCILIGLKYLYVPTKYKGKIINLLCKKETLGELEFLLNAERQIVTTKREGSIHENEYFILDIDYNNVIPFLCRFLAPERLGGTLYIWRQYFDLSLQKKVKAKEESVIEYGFSFIEYALKLETHDHDLLITHLLEFMKKSTFWEKDEKLALKYFTLLLIHTLHVEDPKLYAEFSGAIAFVLGKMPKFIIERNLLGNDHEIFSLLPQAIMKSFYYNIEKFEEFANGYWTLNSLSGVAVFNKSGGMIKFVQQLSLLSTSEYERKKEFVEMMLGAIYEAKEVILKIAILKMTGIFLSDLRKEIETVPQFVIKRREELKAIFLEIQKAFDLKEAFDSLKNEIETMLEEIVLAKGQDKVELWKRAGYLLAYLKKEVEKQPQLLKEKKEVLDDLDRKVKEGFNLLRRN